MASAYILKTIRDFLIHHQCVINACKRISEIAPILKSKQFHINCIMAREFQGAIYFLQTGFHLDINSYFCLLLSLAFNT